jgi:parvulin-like peptidyl-prolyl isomerase
LSSGILTSSTITWFLVSNTFRASALAVLALAALPVLSACTNDTSPGAAALVGSQRITTGQLQTQLNESLSGGQLQAQQGFNRAAFERELLGHMISVALVNATAADHHVTVTSQDIAAQQATYVKAAGSLAALEQQAASGGVTAKQLPGFVRFAALQSKLGNALVAGLTATPAQLAAEYQKDIDQYDQIDVAQIAVKSKALADQILAKVKRDPAAFATLAAKHSVDPKTKDKGGVVGFVGRTEVQSIAGAKATLKPGTYLVAHSGSDYVVLHVISRRTVPQSAVTAQLKSSLFSSQEQALLTKAISAEAVKLGVHVSPRYGHWDAKTGAVVANANPTVSSTATPSPTSTG